MCVCGEGEGEHTFFPPLSTTLDLLKILTENFPEHCSIGQQSLTLQVVLMLLQYKRILSSAQKRKLKHAVQKNFCANGLYFSVGLYK